MIGEQQEAPGAGTEGTAFDALASSQAEGLGPNFGRWLRFLGARQGTWIEFQALGVRNGRGDVTKFAHAANGTDANRLLSEIEKGEYLGVFIIPNTIADAVSTRAERGKWHLIPKGGGTSDRDITHRRVLFFDVDAVRPKGTSATDDEIAHADAVARELYSTLVDIFGTDAPIGVGDSGNGRAVFLALAHIPESPELALLVKGIVQAASLLFSTREAHVDPTVVDAKRLAPAFGTLKRKGAAGIPERPHRRTSFTCAKPVARLSMADLVTLQDALTARLSAEQRGAYDKAMGIRPPKPERVNGHDVRTGNDDWAQAYARGNECDIRDVCDWLGLVDGGDVRCPGCGTVGDSSVAIVNGGLKCLHATCADKGHPSYPGFRTAIDLVMEVRGVDNRGALRLLSERFGFSLPSPRMPEPRDPYEDEERAGIQDETPEPSSAPPTSVVATPESIVNGWREEGPLERVPTGIEPLDRMCRGGLPVPWRVIFVGAPSAGKTAVEVCVADHVARSASEAGLCVGILAVDEEPDDLTVRLLQIANFTVAQTELRDPEQLAEMAEAVRGLRIRFYDLTWTIESAATDLAAWAKAENRRAVFMIDSLQAATSALAANAKGPREHVEANVKAMRMASTKLRMLVIATSEANRASYRTDDAAETTNDMAAGAESRAIEFGAQTQLMLRTPKDSTDVIHVRVAKNRRADRGEFWLRLDRDRHSVSECPDPNADPRATAVREEEKRGAELAKIEADARKLIPLVLAEPGLGERALRTAVKGAGYGWGHERLDVAKARLVKGLAGSRLVNRGGGNAHRWHVEPIAEES